jgi:F-type H+-transporting ATPase subunit epsilon
MLPDRIELEVVTPERHVLAAQVDSVEVPGRDGYLGVLPGHAPLLTELGIGLLTYRESGSAHVLVVTKGYAEVLPGRVIVLAEGAERADEIDVRQAQAEAERAKEAVVRAGTKNGEWQSAQAALERAVARVQAAQAGHTHASN